MDISNSMRKKNTQTMNYCFHIVMRTSKSGNNGNSSTLYTEGLL